jgi:hypothetical protein
LVTIIAVKGWITIVIGEGYRGFRNSVSLKPQNFMKFHRPLNHALETSSNEDSKYMSCVESSICVECSGGLEIDGLLPFSARPKCVWVGEMSLFINKNSIYFIRHEFCI